MTNSVRKQDLLHPELSYTIIGIFFGVYNELGPGHKEKYYENAVEESFKKAGIKHKKQLYLPLKFNGKKIGSYFLDFLVQDTVVLELKKCNYFSKRNIEQVLEYL